jgi:hypothetical protein
VVIVGLLEEPRKGVVAGVADPVPAGREQLDQPRIFRRPSRSTRSSRRRRDRLHVAFGIVGALIAVPVMKAIEIRSAF